MSDVVLYVMAVGQALQAPRHDTQSAVTTETSGLYDVSHLHTHSALS